MLWTWYVHASACKRFFARARAILLQNNWVEAELRGDESRRQQWPWKNSWLENHTRVSTLIMQQYQVYDGGGGGGGGVGEQLTSVGKALHAFSQLLCAFFKPICRPAQPLTLVLLYYVLPALIKEVSHGFESCGLICSQSNDSTSNQGQPTKANKSTNFPAAATACRSFLHLYLRISIQLLCHS